MSSHELSSVVSNANLTLPTFTSDETPSVSQETMKIFREQEFTLPDRVIGLKGKVSDLEQTQTKLISAKEHSTRDKIVSFLAMLLAISIVVAGVLGTYYGVKANTIGGAVVAGILPIVALIAAYGLTAFYNYKWSDDDKGVVPSLEYLDPIILPIIGPFIPVYQTFGNVSRYQKASEQKTRAIQGDVEEGKQFFIQNREPSSHLLALLKRGISEIETNLENIQTISIRSPEAESALSTQLEQLKKAEAELEAVMTFFQK